MKKLFSILLLTLSTFGYSQNYWYYEINFEDTSEFFRLNIETVSNPNNIWQIGEPQKSIFQSANSTPNAIVTDTLNSYPVNDTSKFIIKHIVESFGGFDTPQHATIAGKYKVNSDTLNDFGMIEFSPDNGNTWVDLLSDTLYLNQGCYLWSFGKPSLSGNVSEWTDFYVNVAGFGPVFNIEGGDTVLYRFTFISDSIESNKDGLIIDDLYINDVAEGISNSKNQFESKIIPNPTSDNVIIQFINENNEPFEFSMSDLYGNYVLIKRTTNNSSIKLNLSNFDSGTYFYRIINKKNQSFSFGKILKQ